MRYIPYLRKGAKVFNKHNILPEYVTFFVTNECNARCEHCFYWKELGAPVNALSLGEIEKISGTMGDFLFLLLTGGEPFLRNDFSEIVKIFYKNNNVRKINIFTNGNLPKETSVVMTKIMTECPDAYITLFVSLDEIGDEHDKNRGIKGIYKNALETIRCMKEIQAVYAKLTLGIALVYTSFNEKRILDIYNFCKGNIKVDTINCAFIRGAVRNTNAKACSIDNFIELQKTLENDLIKNRLRGARDPILGNLVAAVKFESFTQLIKIVKEDRYLFPCYAGKINAVIYPNGDVFPCELLNEKMGNLRDVNYDFKKIWFSEKSEKIRETIKVDRCYCTHECNLVPNIMFNLRFSFKVIKNFLRLIFRIC